MVYFKKGNKLFKNISQLLNLNFPKRVKGHCMSILFSHVTFEKQGRSKWVPKLWLILSFPPLFFLVCFVFQGQNLFYE